MIGVINMVELTIREYLKGETIEALGNIGIISNPGVIRSKEETGFSKDSFEIGVRLPNNEEYIYCPNVTSQKNFIAEWGRDTKKWVGRPVLFSVQDMVVQGKKVKVIFGEPNEETVKGGPE